jgi:hypothetical protein
MLCSNAVALFRLPAALAIAVLRLAIVVAQWHRAIDAPIGAGYGPGDAP